MRCRQRATWLEFSGLPLHCWNAVTLKRLAELWGTLDALGVNSNHTRDCEKVTVLISTNQVQKIEEVVDVEIGDRLFEVGVVELDFTDRINCSDREEECIKSHYNLEELNVMVWKGVGVMGR
ncbi:hypothetical protein V6N13_073467 [Hibiscus sabdariffa]